MKLNFRKTITALLAISMLLTLCSGLSISVFATDVPDEEHPVRLVTTGDLFDTLNDAISAANNAGLPKYTLEVIGDVTETSAVVITSDVTIIGAEGQHAIVLNSPILVQNSGKLTLGDGKNEKLLTIFGSIQVYGMINVKDGITLGIHAPVVNAQIVSISDPEIVEESNDGELLFRLDENRSGERELPRSVYGTLLLSGPDAHGVISGGRIEGGDIALSLENGAQLSEISGGVFTAKQDAVHLTDAGTRIDKISGGEFYQTDQNTNTHGHAVFVQNEAQIGEISGGYFEAVRNCALIVVRGGWVDEISGGEFVATRQGTTSSGSDQWNSVLHVHSENNARTGIGTISGGFFHGGARFGMILTAEGNFVARVNEITGGLFNGIVGVQLDLGGEIGTISGGTMIARQGMLNVGNIGEICGDVEIRGTSSYGIFNYNYYGNFDDSRYYGTIGKISGNAIISGDERGIANVGKINMISGGTITGTSSLVSYGITNTGAINMISGGTIIGEQYAIYCGIPSGGQVGVNGVIGTISGGVFWGKTKVALRLSSDLQLEPGLSATKGLGRYQSGSGQSIFNDDDLVTYPILDGATYFMSTLTEPVVGIDGIAFKFLTLSDKYDIIYELNGGVNHPDNPDSYNDEDLPVAIFDPSKTGYTFGGWRVTYADGSTAGPVANYQIPLGASGDIVLVATWSLIGGDSYVVVYNGNGFTGGSVPVDRFGPYEGGDQVTVLGQGSMTRGGYVFLGWSTVSSVNAAVYVAGSTFNIYNDVTLFAVWQEDTYVVSFAPGGHGTFAVQVTSGLRYGDVTPAAPAVTGEVGWRFTGWSPALSTTVTGSITYTAQWAQNTTVTPTPTASPSPSVSPTPTPTASPPSVSPTPTASPSPSVSPTPTPTASPSPPVIGDGRWALLNLILCVLGVILTVITTVRAVLLKKKRGKDTVNEDKLGQNGVQGRQYVAKRSDKEEHQKFVQRRSVWLIASIVLAVVGVVVFCLTENMSLPRVWLDRWTIVNAIILIAEIVTILLVFKKQKK
ncbi:MAG: InlB B-repeat-containing protein [Candidatus Bathyarchaeota archaeon]|nr:InlB B-repeat-containing protein [Candidatus Termiticorpusculum sp.]